MKVYKNEIMECIWKGENILFTFKSEAEQFAAANDLQLFYNDGDLLDEEHYEVRGFKSKFYWIAR